MFKYAFGVTHKNSPCYLCQKQNYDRIRNAEGTLSFVLVEIHNVKLLEKRQSKS